MDKIQFVPVPATKKNADEEDAVDSDEEKKQKAEEAKKTQTVTA